MTNPISPNVRVRVAKRAQLSGHRQPVYALCKGPDHDMFYSAGGDKWIAAWHLSQPDSAIAVAQAVSSVYSLCFIPDRKWLAVGESSGAITLIDLNASKPIKRIDFHKSGVFSMHWNEKAQRLYATTSNGEFSAWDLDNQQPIFYKKMADQKIRGMEIDIISNLLFLAVADGFVYVLNADSFSVIHQFQAHPWAVNVVRLDTSSHTLISASRDAHIRRWDIKNNFSLMQSVPAHNYAIYQLCFSPDNKMLASASRDKTIKIWDPNTLQPLTRINFAYSQSHNRSVNNLLWHEFENLLISCGDDHQIMVWEVQMDS